MTSISKSDFISKCKRDLEKERIRLDIYGIIESVIEENKDKRMNARIARKIEEAIILPDFSVYVSIGTEWADDKGKRGIHVNIVKDGIPGLRWQFCAKIPHVIEKQELDYKGFCETVSKCRESAVRNIESLNYAIGNLDGIISQSKNLLGEIKEFYRNLPSCMYDYALHCGVYESTPSLIGIY